MQCILCSRGEFEGVADWLPVPCGFTVENRHLMKRLPVSKGYEATRLSKMFLDRQWNADGVKTLI